MDNKKLRSASRKLLGTDYRLEVASECAKHERGSFTIADIVAATKIEYPRVQQELARLEAAGLLTRAGRGVAGVDFAPTKSVYWSFATKLRAETERRLKRPQK